MEKFQVVLLFLSALVTASSSSARIVCYFTSWSRYKPGDNQFQSANVDATICNHIIYAYIALDENGEVTLLDDFDQTLLELDRLGYLKNRNPDLKVFISMGGFNDAPAIFSEVAADPHKRLTMARTVVNHMGQFAADGFELAWEYPGLGGGDPENDPVNFVTLLSELKTVFEQFNLILSISVGAQSETMNISYPDVKAISDSVDQINVMAYDKSDKKFGGYDQTLQLELDVVAGIKEWINKGADPAKLNLGMSTYGRSFALDGTGGSVMGYNEICQLGSEWESEWNEELQIPNKVNGSQRIVYEDTRSLAIKAGYVKELGIEGAAVWSLDTDDFLGRCGESFPLIKSVKNELN